MHPNEDLIHRFFRAMQKHDLSSALLCYHNDITYEDDLFRELKQNDVVKMWEMRMAENPDWEIEYRDVEASAVWGRAYWTLVYGKTKSGKRKRRHIVARFTFLDEKILYHSDAFNLYNWVTENRGAWWRVLVWFSPFRYFLRAGAHRKLQQFKDQYRLQMA